MILKTKISVLTCTAIATLSLFLINGCNSKGCKVPCATNFDKDAKEDDGDCDYTKPPEAVTLNFRSSWLIDFATGKIDSSNYPCGMANYEDDMLILIETSSGSPIHVYFDIEFPHKAKGDTSCNGPKYDMGGSAALISGSPQPDDQNWSTCENSPVDFQGRTAALVAGKYYVLRTREENFYKIYIEQILYNGTTPVGVKMTRVAMKK